MNFTDNQKDLLITAITYHIHTLIKDIRRETAAATYYTDRSPDTVRDILRDHIAKIKKNIKTLEDIRQQLKDRGDNK